MDLIISQGSPEKIIAEEKISKGLGGKGREVKIAIG